MIDGEPNASDDPGKQAIGLSAELECLPEPLRFGVMGNDGRIDWTARTEPIAADARPGGQPVQGWTTGAAYREHLEQEGQLRADIIQRQVSDYEKRLELAKLKVIAGALGVPLGELTQRDKTFQLNKARQRAQLFRRIAAGFVILALLALAGAGVAWWQRARARAAQKEAERQTAIARTERDRALKQVYLNTVRSAAEHIEAGEYARGRQLLLSCPTELRAWEWWYLVARCGPGPMPLSELSNLEEPSLAKAAGTLRSQLDEMAQNTAGNEYDPRRVVPPQPANAVANQLILSYQISGAKNGTSWDAWRGGDPSGSVLLNSFYTGFGGLRIAAILLGPQNSVCWKAEVSQDRSPARMAGGDPVLESGDHIAFLRERYIVGEPMVQPSPGPLAPDSASAKEEATWPDNPPTPSRAARIRFRAAKPSSVRISPDGDDRATRFWDPNERNRRLEPVEIDTESGQVSVSTTDRFSDLIPFWELEKLQAQPSPAALAAVLKERESLPSEFERDSQIVRAQAGAAGPGTFDHMGSG